MAVWYRLRTHGWPPDSDAVASRTFVVDRAAASSRCRGGERTRLIAWFVPALLALLALHVAEPDLPLSWGFAGLRAAWGSVVPAMVCAGLVLAVVAAAWRSPIGARPVPRMRVAPVAAGTVAVWLVLALTGLQWPAPDVCPDAMFLPHQLRTGGAGSVRWLLAVPLLQLLYAPFRAHVDPDLALRVINALFSTLSVALTLAIAVRLGRTLREVAAIVLLVWTGLGSLQLALGYVDIYPLVQLFVALYLWTALRYLDGDGSIVWPLLVAVVGPCFYIGLILLAPSLLVPLYAAYRRSDLAPVALAVCVAPLIVGLATVPTFGAPFALRAWLDRLADVGLYGLNPGRQTLPLAYMLSLRHAGEVLSTLILLDGTALALLAALPARTSAGAFLAVLLASGLAFVVAMDPLWGPYSDWDLFSYLTLPLGVAAGLAFATWSRVQPRAAGLVLGLALATSTVHLLARLNALHLDFPRHVAASPFHIPGVPSSVFNPTVRRSVP